MSNTIADLTEIATELIVNELKRRAVEKGMTVEEFLAEAKETWNKADDADDVLADKGHETE